tara:strand:- start:245 stop:574 length:330 start_codon:yes stop_codon:yes gene_type:complete
MANTFKNKTFNGNSTTANTNMAVYTAPSSTTTVVIGLTLANTTSSQITADIKLAAADTIYLAKDIPIPAGSAFEFFAGNKLIMEAGHAIITQSNTANSLDTTLSIMEIT